MDRWASLHTIFGGEAALTSFLGDELAAGSFLKEKAEREKEEENKL